MDFLKCETDYKGGPAVVALGMFDGVHIGHQKLLEIAVKKAMAYNATSIALTFDAHPLSLLRPGDAPVELTNLEKKRRIIEKAGIHTLIARPFSREFADMPPRKYIDYIVKALRPVVIVAGYNYTFGQGGYGDASLLIEMGREYGYEAAIVEPVLFDGVPVSSTLIREAQTVGDIQRASGMLGRPIRE